MDSWSCEYCPDRKFATEEGLAAHMKSVHSEEDNSVSTMKPEQRD
jgi:hypothetical protein